MRQDFITQTQQEANKILEGKKEKTKKEKIASAQANNRLTGSSEHQTRNRHRHNVTESLGQTL